MVKGIAFLSERFNAEDDNNIMCPIGHDIIVLCSDPNTREYLAEEILRTINGKAEYNEYECDTNDVGKASCQLVFALQRVLNINGQTITLCLEPAMVYKAKQIDDIWFAEQSAGNHKISIYPMTVFKGSEEVWEQGLDKVYKTIVGGQYGCYNGSWVNVDGEVRQSTDN
jgi:hypothetical protein